MFTPFVPSVAGLSARTTRAIGVVKSGERVADIAQGLKVAGQTKQVALFASTELRTFKNQQAFVKAFGKAGEHREWHHIVEQAQIKNSGFAAAHIYTTKNTVSLSKEMHTQLNAYYSSIQQFTNGKTVREWLSGRSFEEQYKFGLDRLEKALAGTL